MKEDVADPGDDDPITRFAGFFEGEGPGNGRRADCDGSKTAKDDGSQHPRVFPEA